MKFSFRHNSVGDVETRIFPDTRLKQVETIKEPVVELSSYFELKRAERVRNSLETITDWVGVIVHRVNAPFITDMRVRMELDSIYDWISKSSISMFMVYSGSQRHFAFLIKTKSHLFENLQVFLNGTVSERRRNALSSFSSHFFHGLRTSKSISLFDELHCKLVKFFKVVRSMSDLKRRVAHKLNVFFNVYDILSILLSRIRVVKTQVT